MKKKCAAFAEEVLRTWLIAFFISLILFSIVSASLKVNLLSVLVIELFSLLSYRKKYNGSFFRRFLVVSSGIELAYVLSKYIEGADIKNTEYGEWVLAAACVVVTGLVFIRAIEKYEKPIAEKQSLLRGREHDLERIADYIGRVNILGINAAWGAGKTFLVERLCEKAEIANRFEIVRMDLLVCRLGEIQEELIYELDRLLQKRRVFSGSSKHLRRLLKDNKYLASVEDLFWSTDDSKSALYKSLKEDIRKLDKDVLIIFDDIDRIQDEEIVKQIFAIAESLASDKIKIMYLYEEQNLGLSRKYLEKYIPYTVNLTPLTYEALVRQQWSALGMEETGVKEDEVAYVESRNCLNYSLNKALGIDVSYSLNNVAVSARKVKIFLTEMKQYIQGNCAYRDKKKQEILIRILFLKHFLYEAYAEIPLGETILDAVKFKTSEGEVSIWELIEKREEKTEDWVWSVWKDADNQWAVLIVTFFPYMFRRQEKEYKMKPYEEKREDYANEAEIELRNKENNERIDRVIWNVIANGLSEYTNPEEYLRRLSESVLGKSGEERKKAWSAFCEDAFYGNLWKDNSTLFLLGQEPYIAVFKAFFIAGATSLQWVQWIDFYFSKVGSKGITVEMVEALNYCVLNQKEVFLSIIRRFTNTQIRGNMNSQTGWKRFLRHYLSAIYYLGYLDTAELESHVVEMYAEYPGENNEQWKSWFAGLVHKIEEEQKQVAVGVIKDELKDIEKFINKLEEIVNCAQSIRVREFHADTKWETRWEHQDEVERLAQIKENSEEEFLLSLNESYNKGLLNVREVKHLQNLV